MHAFLLAMLTLFAAAFADQPTPPKKGSHQGAAHQPSWSPHMEVPANVIGKEKADRIMQKYCIECHQPGGSAIDHEEVPGELDFSSGTYLKDEALLREMIGHTKRPETDSRGKQMPPLDDKRRPEFIASGAKDELLGWFVKNREDWLKKNERIDDAMGRQLVNTHCVACHKPEGTPTKLKTPPDLSNDAFLSDKALLAKVLERASLGNDEVGSMPPNDKPGTKRNHDRREYVVSTAASQLPRWLESKLRKLR